MVGKHEEKSKSLLQNCNGVEPNMIRKNWAMISNRDIKVEAEDDTGNKQCKGFFGKRRR